MFLISPGCTAVYDEKTYNPSRIRDVDDYTKYAKKDLIDKMNKYREARLNMVEEEIRWVPRLLVRKAMVEPRWNRLCHRTSP